MKPSMTHQEYQRLELISSQSTKPTIKPTIVTKVVTSLRNIWQALLTYSLTNPELRVWTTTDATGQLVWKVHDPVTQARMEFASEQDLRIWLEERYYQTPEVTLPYMAR